ncbi:hypothetical protein JST97_35290 [bacterium]|nr:hypothetical protein [bacterium]
MELQMLNAGLMQTGLQSGMRAVSQAARGMHCQGQVSSTQTARQAALAQANGEASPGRLFKPLMCLGEYSLHKL